MDFETASFVRRGDSVCGTMRHRAGRAARILIQLSQLPSIWPLVSRNVVPHAFML